MSGGGKASMRMRALAVWFGALSFVLCIAAPALGQTCVFNAGQPNTASFGVIDPTLVTPKTFSVTLNYKCTASAIAFFTITGANDTGPGAYQLRNQAQATQYMPYTITAVNVPGTKITLTGLLVAANYQNAYVGNYTDTLSVLITP